MKRQGFSLKSRAAFVAVFFLSISAGAAELSVTSVEPNLGPVSGGTKIFIQGTGFGAQCTVRVGQSPCSPVSADTDTELSCTAPAGAEGPSDVSVVCGDAAAKLERAFTYYAPLILKTEFPALAPGYSMHLSASGGVPPYRFSVEQNDCFQVDRVTGVLTVSCTSVPVVEARVEDSIGGMGTWVVRLALGLQLEPLYTSVHPGDSFQVSLTAGATGVAPIHYEVISGPAVIDPATGAGVSGNESGQAKVRARDALGQTSEISIQVIAHGYKDPKFGFSAQLDGAQFNVSHLLAIDDRRLVIGSGPHSHFAAFELSSGAPSVQEFPISKNREDSAEGFAKQPDGNILISGESYKDSWTNFFDTSQAALVRVHQNLDIDGSFGKKGIVTFNIRSVARESLDSVLVGPNGEIWGTVQSCKSGNCQPYLVRISARGKVEGSFAVGKSIPHSYYKYAAMESAPKPLLFPMSPEAFFVVVGGYAPDLEGPDTASPPKVFLMRYDAPLKQASLRSFTEFKGVNGFCRLSGIAPSAAGTWVAGAGCTVREDNTVYYVQVFNRWNSDGSLDQSFGDAGVLRALASDQSDVEVDQGGSSFTLESDGQIIMASSGNKDRSQSGMFRIGKDGTADLSFGKEGFAERDTEGGFPRQVSILSDGTLEVFAASGSGIGSSGENFSLNHYVP